MEHALVRLRREVLLVVVLTASTALPQDRTVFTVDTDLQSISVEVADRHGRAIRGLTSADFTLLEDAVPQKISFFGPEEQPVSLTILVDSSASMRSGKKLERVLEVLPPVFRGNLPGDEIYFAQFTDRVFPVQELTGEQRLHPPFQYTGSRACTMRSPPRSARCAERITSVRPWW